MYCPKCGQQQVSDEMRFCSRCGFQLSAVTALVKQDGAPPEQSLNLGTVGELTRRRSTRRGAKLMFAGGVLVPVAVGFGILLDSPLPLLFPFTIFLAGLALMLYSKLFGDESASALRDARPPQFGAAQRDYLPFANGDKANGVDALRANTAEIVQPPSITEGTTKLLDER